MDVWTHRRTTLVVKLLLRLKIKFVKYYNEVLSVVFTSSTLKTSMSFSIRTFESLVLASVSSTFLFVLDFLLSNNFLVGKENFLVCDDCEPLHIFKTLSLKTTIL